MKLTEILAKGRVSKGDTIAMMPAIYGYKEVGEAMKELGAKGLFVDHDVKFLAEISDCFPKFSVVQGDALEFYRPGIMATVHYRPMFNYPHKTLMPSPNNYIYMPGFEDMVKNIARLSPTFILISTNDDRAEMEERKALKENGFLITDKGMYDGRGVCRYIVSKVEK